MKAFITPPYTFSVAAKTLNLSGVPGFSVKRLVGVWNTTVNKPLYALGAAGLGYSSLSGATLTLQVADTVGMADTDVLAIAYETADFDVSGTISALNANGSTGAATANSSVTILNLNGAATLNFQVTGTFVATLGLQVTGDGTNWVTVTGGFISSNASVSQSTITTTGMFQADVSAVMGVRLVTTAFTSGSAVVTVRVADKPAITALDTGLPAGNNVIGAVTQSGAWTTTQSGAWTVGLTAVTPTKFRNTSLLSAAVAVKATSGVLSGWNIYNPNASVVFVKFYNKAQGTTVVGTDTPQKVLIVPPNGVLFQEVVYGSVQESFATALTIAAVTGIADNNSAAPASGLYVELHYV